jgi:hypothetical protein
MATKRESPLLIAQICVLVVLIALLVALFQLSVQLEDFAVMVKFLEFALLEHMVELKDFFPLNVLDFVLLVIFVQWRRQIQQVFHVQLVDMVINMG